MRFQRLSLLRSSLLCVLACVLTAGSAVAQTETVTATASMKDANGVTISAPLTVTVSRYATDAQRDALLAAVKSGGTAAARTLLTSQANAGTVQLGARQTPIKYAYARTLGDGRLITIVTAEPIALSSEGAQLQQATGRSVGLVLLELKTAGAGTGELAPAASVRINDQGGVVTDTAFSEVVRLANVVKK